MAYQHLTQRAYLKYWNLTGSLYLYDKNTESFTPLANPNKILGIEDFQSDEMETAFRDAENWIHNLQSNTEITDPEKKKLLAQWVALHAVRCRLNAEVLGEEDYRNEVDRLTAHLLQHHAYFIIVTSKDTGEPSPIFITGDNPCIQFGHHSTPHYFWFVTASPSKLVIFSPIVDVPNIPPWEINQMIHNAATEHCVSFDEDLHLYDPNFAPKSQVAKQLLSEIHKNMDFPSRGLVICNATLPNQNTATGTTDYVDYYPNKKSTGKKRQMEHEAFQQAIQELLKLGWLIQPDPNSPEDATKSFTIGKPK